MPLYVFATIFMFQTSFVFEHNNKKLKKIPEGCLDPFIHSFVQRNKLFAKLSWIWESEFIFGSRYSNGQHLHYVDWPDMLGKELF